MLRVKKEKDEDMSDVALDLIPSAKNEDGIKVASDQISSGAIHVSAPLALNDQNDSVPTSSLSPMSSLSSDEPPPTKRRRTSSGSVSAEASHIGPSKKIVPKPKSKAEKKQLPGLSPDTVRQRLMGCTNHYVDLDPIIRDTAVSRMFMRDTYGGSAIDVFPPIGAKNIARHGLDDFMYLSLLFHCHAPEVPGVPGIYFHVGTDTVIEAYTSKVYRVFVRLASNVWLYVGQYKLRRGAPFSKEEWNAQKPEVLKTWATQMAKDDWGSTTRCRIAFRLRLGMKPTKLQFQTELMRAQLFGEKCEHITAEQIMDAFRKGEETITPWIMQCVGYDADFQRKIVREFATYVPPPPKPKSEKKNAGNSQKVASGTRKSGAREKAPPRKRRRAAEK